MLCYSPTFKFLTDDTLSGHSGHAVHQLRDVDEEFASFDTREARIRLRQQQHHWAHYSTHQALLGIPLGLRGNPGPD